MTFYVMGTLAILFGIAWVLILTLRWRQQKRQKKELLAEISERNLRVQSLVKDVKIGQTFEVNSEDEATATIAMMACLSGKVVYGTTQWGPDGKGQVTVEGVNDSNPNSDERKPS